MFTKRFNRQFRKTYEKKVANPVNNTLNDVKRFTNRLLNGRNTFSPSAKDMIEKYGNELIVSLAINRDPIPSAVQGLLGMLSFNEIGYDKLFHLSLRIRLSNGVSLVLEKNEVINIATGDPRPLKDGERREIQIVLNVTLNMLLENGHKLMGDDFFSYSVSNNCQMFNLNILHGIGITAHDDFVKQDTAHIFANNPNLRKFANTMTDIAGRMDVVFQGGQLGNTNIICCGNGLFPKKQRQRRY